ncbi:MAG TPA: MFS transporter [Mycobacteriales bacterium]|nr:MFS transporter [Mycobacteriales bacterium]
MTLSAALATSTSYIIQPELKAVARALNSSLPVVSLVAASAVVGYLLGLALLVPLVDRIRAHFLVTGQLLVLGVGLLIAASAPDPAILGVGLFVAGVCASTGAQMSTLAGKYSPRQRRGRVLGTVTAGISAGILLGRIVGGALANWIGWRPTLLTFAFACGLFAVAAFCILPRNVIPAAEPYRAAIRSLPRLLASNRVLRIAAMSGALWFLSFNLIWVSLSLALSLPPLNLSSAVIGLYSLAGLLGIAATRIAGALADRHPAHLIILAGLALSFVSTVTMVFTLDTAPILLVALALFDAGLFAAQVTNQSRVLGLDPKHPAKFNSAYMVVYFVGGSVGTGIGGSIVDWLNWPGAAAIAGAAVAAAAMIVLTTAETVRPAP